jgi:hypothetical protein
MTTTVTARDITAVMRELHPAPVRLSVTAASYGVAGFAEPGTLPASFRLRLPLRCHQADTGWLAGYLSRHLGATVTIPASKTRVIRRRDYSRDVEYRVEVKS